VPVDDDGEAQQCGGDDEQATKAHGELRKGEVRAWHRPAGAANVR
jgi:hypothetical protein